MRAFVTPVSILVEYIPVIATVVTTILSVVLARATLRYAKATDKSLALAREEFERQWSPELHVKLEKLSSRKTNIVVTNLAVLLGGRTAEGLVFGGGVTPRGGRHAGCLRRRGAHRPRVDHRRAGRGPAGGATRREPA